MLGSIDLERVTEHNARRYMGGSTLALALGLTPAALEARLRRQAARWEAVMLPAPLPDGAVAAQFCVPLSRLGVLLGALRPRSEAAQAAVAAALVAWGQWVDGMDRHITGRRSGLSVHDYLRMATLRDAGLDNAQIAKRVGCAEGTVRVFLAGKQKSFAARSARDLYAQGCRGDQTPFRKAPQTGVKGVVYSAQVTG